MLNNSTLRPVTVDDSSQIAEIYNYYILNSIVTFEEEVVSASEIAARIQQARDSGLPYLVAEIDDKLTGYAYASKWKGRCAYKYSVEVTVYLAPDATGQGWGSKLYRQLFAELRKHSYHVALAGIALPNAASVALHERFGMQKAAHFSEVGFKFGAWVDVGYWQGMLQE